MAEQTFEFNGKMISMDELNAKMAELRALQTMEKAAKKAGVIVAVKKEAKEKPAEILLLIGNFVPTITANIDVIAKLFDGTKDANKPSGNIGINLATPDDCPYDIQILSKAARKSQVAEMKDKQAKEKELKRIAALPETMDLDTYSKLSEGDKERYTADPVVLNKYVKIPEVEPEMQPEVGVAIAEA